MGNMICRICGQPINLSKDNFEISSLEGGAHTDCIKRKEHEDWHNSIKKFFNVDGLKQENQALKDRWEKLKKWVDESGCFLDDGSFSGDVVISIYAILDKMQELEQEQTNADL